MSLAEITLQAGQSVEILTPTGYPTRRLGEIVELLPGDLFKVLETDASRVEVLPRHRLRPVDTGQSLSLPDFVQQVFSNMPSAPSASVGAVDSDTIQMLYTMLTQYIQEQVLGALTAFRPRITRNPQSQTVAPGQSASFLVLASVATNSHLQHYYQWEQSSDGGQTWDVVPGAMSPEYELQAAQPSQSGSLYRCRVYNWFGVEYSQAATLTVQ